MSRLSRARAAGGVRLETEGLERLGELKAAVVAANHSSNFDVYALDLPAGNIEELSPVWKVLSAKPIRTNSYTAFRENGFWVRYGRLRMWQRVQSLLAEAGEPLPPREVYALAAESGFTKGVVYRARKKLEGIIVNTDLRRSPKNRWALVAEPPAAQGDD